MLFYMHLTITDNYQQLHFTGVATPDVVVVKLSFLTCLQLLPSI